MTQRDYTGWSSQTSYGDETTYGTKAATTNTAFKGKIITCGIQSDSSVVQHRSKSSGRNVGSHLPGRVKVAGPIEMNPQSGVFLKKAFGAIYKGAKGDATTTPVAADASNTILTGCMCTAQTTPNMTLKIAAGGTYKISGTSYTTTAVASITIGAAHATLDRIDIVSIKDNTGTTVATVTAGTAAASPVPKWESVPATDLVVAVVWVKHAVSVINTTDVRQVFWAKEANSLDSISVEDDYINPEGTITDDIVRIFTGLKVNEFSFGVSREQTDPVKFVYNFIGKRPYFYTGATQAASTITESSAGFFLEWDAQLEVASGTAYDLNDFSFSLNNGLKTKGTDSRYNAKLIEGQRVYKASAKIDLLDKTEVEREYGLATATEPQTTIGTFAINFKLRKANAEWIQFYCPTCSYNKTPTSDPLDDVIQQDLDINISSCKVLMIDATEQY